ncbi:multidrug transporter membrane component/ATP-binding component [Salmonella enterica subsp. enterica]|nr:multidrug transporter membrane component/ATP-binding component [Salmonella enterica subsp. enterica]
MVFHYQDNAFSVGPINLTIHRGELLFLIAATVAEIDAGHVIDRFIPAAIGTILLDGQPIAAGQAGRLSQNCFLRCSPMCGYSTACWGAAGETRQSRSGRKVA